MDPATRASYRREFVDIAKGMEPLDALVLEKLNTRSALEPSRQAVIAKELGVSADMVGLSLSNLERMSLAVTIPRMSGKMNPNLTPLGRVFLKAVRPGTETPDADPTLTSFFDIASKLA